MLNRRSFACAIALSFLFAGLFAAVARADEELDILEVWIGSVPESVFDLLPAAEQDTLVGYIDQEKTFHAFWKAMNGPERAPSIDFKKSVVLFVRNTREPRNLLKVSASSDGHGLITLNWNESVNHSTPQGHVQCAMLVVDRALVKRVKGNATVVSLPEEKTK